jgi:hypothetical protein
MNAPSHLLVFFCEQDEIDALDGEGLRAYPKKETPANPDGGPLYQDHPWTGASIPGYSR